MKFKNRLKEQVLCQNSGFTIIEVMIAIAILAIGILGMATMQTTAMDGNSTAGKITSNSNWAINRIEQVMAMDYDDPDLTGSVYDHSTDASLAAHLAANPATGLHQPAAGADGIDNNRDGEIDETGETGDMSIEWRVVQDYPILDTKWIRITVTQGVGSGRKSSFIIYYKLNPA